MDFLVSADHTIKLKECEKKDKYLGLARELKKLWNMKVTIVPNVIGTLGTVTKGLLKGLGNKRTNGDNTNYCIIEIGQNTKKSPGDWEENCCHSNSSERSSANADAKNFQGIVMIIIIISGDDSIIKISQNTEKSPGDLRRLAVT